MAGSGPIPADEGLEVVILGSFNPGIFHPEWFLHNRLIDQQEADASDTKINVVGREVTEIHICGMKVMSLSDRLVVSTTNISQAARIQDLLFQIFALLSHIPVTACGINAHAFYHVSTRDYWHEIGHRLVPKDLIWNSLLQNPGMKSVTVMSLRTGEFPGETNLTVEPSFDPRFDPGLFVRSNYHYQLPKESTHSGSVDLLVRFLKSEYETGLQFARKTASMVFEKIKPKQ